MILFFGLMQIVLASPAQNSTTNLLDVSYGILGRGTPALLNAEAAYQCSKTAVLADEWNYCGALWQTQIESQSLQSDSDLAVMWSVVSYIRADNYADAYEQLGILIPRAENIGWSVLVLESWLLNALGGTKESILILKDCPQREADYIGAQIVLLEAYQERGKQKKVRKLKEAIISSGKADAWFWWWIAQSVDGGDKTFAVHQMIEGKDATVFHYQEAIQYFTVLNDFASVLNIGLDGMENFAQTERLKLQLLELFSGEKKRLLLDKIGKIPEHSQAQALLGAVYLTENEYEKAEEHFSLAIQYGVDQEDVFEELIEMQILQGNQVDARKTVGLAIQKHPRNQKFWAEFWQLSRTTEEQLEFLESLNQAFMNKKSLPNALLKRGFEVSTNLQQREQAITWAEREIKQSNSWRAWSRKAQAFQLDGQLKEAIEAYEQALRIAPNNSFILNNLAWLLVQSIEGQSEDPQRALAYAVKAIDISNTPKAGFYDTLAAILWILERRSEALKIQKEAVDLEPSNLEYQEKLQVYQKYSSVE